jgi:PilZ domain
MFLSRFFASDRRRQPRQLVNTSVRVFSQSNCIEALGINLSGVGMCLFTPANLPVGSQIEVEFVPADGRTTIRVPATVRHRALYLYGIEFPTDPAEIGDQPSSSFRAESPTP